jgi:hypothetical protein
MRIKSVYNVSLRLLKGLRFFTEKKYAAITKVVSEPIPSDSPQAGDVLEKSVSQLQLTMIELDDTLPTKMILQPQFFYDTFDVLVNLALGGFLAYLWSMLFHCAVPGAVTSCWVALLLLVFMLFSFQCLLQVIILTGWRARETKLAVGVGLVVTLLSVALYFATGLSYVTEETVMAVAVHANAMMRQMSKTMPMIAYNILVPAVQVLLSMFLGFMAATLVIPAIRYSQAMEAMHYGVRASIISDTDKNIMWIDFFLPLIAGLLFSEVPMLAYYSLSGDHPSRYVCTPLSHEGCAALPEGFHSPLANFKQAMMLAQLTVGAAMVVVRVQCMSKHLQCFLDSVVRIVALHMMAATDGMVPDTAVLLPKVKVYFSLYVSFLLVHSNCCGCLSC